MKTLLLALMLALAPGCALMAPKPPVTHEAAQYQSFKRLFDTTLAIYDFQMDLRVAGKISPSEARDIDLAWNLFRAVYREELAKARGDDTTFASDKARASAEDVTTLINAVK